MIHLITRQVKNLKSSCKYQIKYAECFEHAILTSLHDNVLNNNHERFSDAKPFANQCNWKNQLSIKNKIFGKIQKIISK